ncbi:MAG: phosphatidate cytidylyltransferase [Muribaculaceae bacterium]|nr:phosphatidate cytidylyltransferase [Muribaculaceae bacterium]
MNIKSWLLRSASGLVYVGIIIGSLFWGIYPFTLMAVFLGVMAVFEFERICEGISENNLPLTLLDAGGVAAICFFWQGYPIIIWLFIYLCRCVMELYMKSQKPIRCMAISLMTQIYIGMPLGIMTVIGNNVGLHFILAIFLMIWINDTGAFVIGTLFGRHRLFERVSPKKSWEGFFGGLCFNLMAAWLFAIGGGHFWSVEWNVITWLLFALVITLFATWGDLIESLIKRSLCIKDSGSIIPGHGGILDRIDSLLLVMPAVLLFVLLRYLLSIAF